MKMFKVIRTPTTIPKTKYNTGTLISGVVFDDGTTVIKWNSDVSSIAIYKSWEDFYEIHIGAYPEYN